MAANREPTSEDGLVEDSDRTRLEDAVKDAERRAGEAEGRVVELEERLAVAEAAQREWDRLMDLIEAERADAQMAIANHQAIINSTSWRMTSAMMVPYRYLRRSLGSGPKPTDS